MTDRLRCFKEYRESLKKKKTHPYFASQYYKNIILVNNYPHSNLPHYPFPPSRTARMSIPGLPETFHRSLYLHATLEVARYCGRAAGLTPSYLVTRHPIPDRVASKRKARRQGEKSEDRELRVILLELGFPSFVFFLLLIRQACTRTVNVCMAWQGN